MWREEFTYDTRGNRTQQTSPWGTLESSYNAASQLLQTGNRSFSYDDNGNLTSGQLGDQITSYEYDGRNRLVSVQDSIMLPKHPWNNSWHNRGDGSINPFTRDVSYGYDALGRRISETEVGEHPWDYYLPGKGRKSGDPDISTRHEVTVYRGLGFDPLARLETANYVPRVGSWFGSWIGSWFGGHYGKSRPGYRFFPFQRHLDHDFEVLDVYTHAHGDVLMEAAVSGGSTKGNGWGWGSGWGYSVPSPRFTDKTYFHTDQLGSTVLMTDDRGLRKIDVSYDAFGQVLGKILPDLDFGYNGKPLDSITGLYNYGFRDYDPGSGRFTTVDPIRDGDNWYGYVNSDPVNYFDWLGLCAQTIPEQQAGQPTGLTMWKAEYMTVGAGGFIPEKGITYGVGTVTFTNLDSLNGFEYSFTTSTRNAFTVGISISTEVNAGTLYAQLDPELISAEVFRSFSGSATKTTVANLSKVDSDSWTGYEITPYAISKGLIAYQKSEPEIPYESGRHLRNITAEETMRKYNDAYDMFYRGTDSREQYLERVQSGMKDTAQNAIERRQK